MARASLQSSVLLLASAIGAAGCSPTIRRPQLLSPGTASFQRYNAGQFDPYPPNDLGPEISGGRPIDAIQPRNEVTRSRQHRNGERPLLTPGPVPIMAPLPAPATYPTTVPSAYPSAAAPSVTPTVRY